MQANSKMAEVMGETTKAMGAMNKVVNPAKLNQTLQEFSKQSTKMEMTDEMSKKNRRILINLVLKKQFSWILFELILVLIFVVNDTLEDVFAESGDEEETDQIVNQVLDEIGIEISGKVWATILSIIIA